VLLPLLPLLPLPLRLVVVVVVRRCNLVRRGLARR
jgi:hypothetical protein